MIARLLMGVLRLVAWSLLYLVGWQAGAVSITAFSPSSGPAGTVITLTGSGFTTATNLVFNPSAPTLGDFVVVSDSQITAVVPLGAQSGNLRVGSSSSGMATTASNFVAAPYITSFSPATAGYPGQIYILGANFISGSTQVTFAGVSTPVNGTVVSATEVSAAVPSGAVTGPLIVTTAAGSASSSSNLIAGSLPNITGFSPVAGPAGTQVTITGGNFFNVSAVAIGTLNASSFSVPSATEIVAYVATNSISGTVRVTTSAGAAATSTNFQTGAVPIITDFSPGYGKLNSVVNIDGYNLTTVTNVTINGSRQYISATTPLQITITNAATTSGPIVVKSPSGTGTSPSNFTMLTGPLVTDFNPVLGAPGSMFVIHGVNFTGATSVKIGNAAASFSIVADTQITATVPNSPSGTVSVGSSAGTSTTTSNFSITGTAPIITSFTPTNGVRGSVVTINGGNFTNMSTPGVDFNGVAGTYTPPTSTTVLYGTVPATATTGLIDAKTSSGTGTSSSMFYLQPWVTGSTAAAVAGASLVLDGRNLTNAQSVNVNGVNYSFTNSPTRIVATVPSNATPGRITVTAPGGVFIVPNSFVVLPKIYGFSPTIGPAGTIVTITGTSLFDVTNVQFNGTGATPYNITTNQLQVAVPAGATPGPITVFVPGGSDISTNNFTATYSSTVNLIKYATPTVVGPGSNVVYTILVTNLGPSAITSVTVTDTIPTNFIVAGFTTSVGSAALTNGILIASLGNISSNGGGTITVTGTSANLGALTNSASVGFAEGDTIYGNPNAYTYVYFISAAQKTLSITNASNPGQFLLTWPVSDLPFELQGSTNLANTNVWVHITNIYATNGFYTYVYTNTSNAPPPAEFFRLQFP